MKKSTKLTLAGGILLMTAVLSSGCTNNMCTNLEKCRMLFAYEPGVSEYFDSEEEANKVGGIDTSAYNITIEKVDADNNNLWRRVVVAKDTGFYWKTKATEVEEGKEKVNEWYAFSKLSDILSTAKGRSLPIPTQKYFVAVDNWVINNSINTWNDKYPTNPIDIKTVKASELTRSRNVEKGISEGALVEYGWKKFGGHFNGNNDETWPEMFEDLEKFNGEIALEIGIENCPTRDFFEIYKSTLNNAVANTKSCIAIDDYNYGNYGQDGVSISIKSKDWGYAWSRGPISGLIVWPVAALTDVLAKAFAGGNYDGAMQQGWPQLLSLLVVTLIVRLVIFGLTFKSTLSQQKMQSLQPELAKIQAKYPNSNTNQSEKQRMAEEQMKLYKKHGVNPLSSLLTILIQFPIFIGVWGAMTGSAVLSTGRFLNLNLSTSILDALKNFDGMPSNMYGWWTALILFVLMSVAQFLSMKIPQWITKAKTKKVARLGVNPAQKSSNRTANIISWVMLIMIIIMGFTLPAAMGVYWLVGAVISLALSLITQKIVNTKRN